MRKIIETSDGVFIEIDDSDTRTLHPLSDKDRIAELELRIGHLGNALEGAENDCVTLSAEVDRLRALVGRLQQQCREWHMELESELGRDVEAEYLHVRDLDPLEDV